MGDHETSGAVEEQVGDEVGTELPPLYRVVLLNDDFTPMDFVVQILVTVFQKGGAEATRIMLAVHHQGKGVCGIYSRDVAESKVAQVHRLARQEGHPLRALAEKV